MRIDILSLFPDMFTGVLQQSILKKASEKGIVSYHVTNFRDFADNKHQNVDDYPYGGGAGMVLMPQPIFDAVESVIKETESNKRKPRVILLTPQGERFGQKKAEELAAEDQLIFICGHYEGFDERIRQQIVTDEISIGDFILTGGELASMVVIDSVVRLLPGVLGNETSPQTDSFSNDRLEHPHYTRPANFRGQNVPDVLLSGNHQLIETWRLKESFRRTYERRPDLILEESLTSEENVWLAEMKQQSKH